MGWMMAGSKAKAAASRVFKAAAAAPAPPQAKGGEAQKGGKASQQRAAAQDAAAQSGSKVQSAPLGIKVARADAKGAGAGAKQLGVLQRDGAAAGGSARHTRGHAFLDFAFDRQALIDSLG
mmetsp:Transcript_1859/g.5612  ORF Transcript_1859/g.5612 Transcript_1859/m.5612 type:complete len:121 (-) Transcript_1859:304-666(-)